MKGTFIYTQKNLLRPINGAGQRERLTPPQSTDIQSGPQTKCHWAHLAASADTSPFLCSSDPHV